MGTVFWDAQGCILVEFLKHNETINAVLCVETLVKLQSALHGKWLLNKIILKQSNSRPHSCWSGDGESWKNGLGNSSAPCLQPRPSSLRLSSFWFCEWKNVRPALRYNKGPPPTSASVPSVSWNRVLAQGDFQACRTMQKKCVQRNGCYVEKL